MLAARASHVALAAVSDEVVVAGSASCARLRELGDDYCDHIPYVCALNNAANPTGTYGLEAGFQVLAALPADLHPLSCPSPGSW